VEELKYLFQQPLFKGAVAMTETLTDLERVAALGQRVLAERKPVVKLPERLPPTPQPIASPQRLS